MLSSILAIFCFFLLIIAIRLVREINAISIFEKINLTKNLVYPKLSIVIAACNEELTIKDAIKTISQQNYPNMEIIAINDRSKDNTDKIIDALSISDSRIKAVHIDSLPSGWLGKVHALHKGASIATGEWILFTDADIHFETNTIQKAINYSIEKKLDHLAIIPKLFNPNKDFWLDVTILTFLTTFIQVSTPSNIEKIGSSAYTGSGGFNLVRHDAFKKTLGFEWLKMEVVDDVGLGLMMKKHGFASSLSISNKDISVIWYYTLSEMIKGLEKNSFLALAQGKLLKLIILVFLLFIYIASPILALFIGFGYTKIIAILALLSFIISSIYVAKKLEQNIIKILFYPLGLLILFFIVFRSAFKSLKQGGIYWRGTFYSMKDLLEGQRVKKF